MEALTNELTPEQVAKARLFIARATKEHVPPEKIAAFVQKKLGVDVEEVLRPNERDFWRTLASGVTLGHGDELAGAFVKLLGGDYKDARDAARQESEAFKATHGTLDAATDAAAGSLPMAAAAPAVGAAVGAVGKGIASAPKIKMMLDLLSHSPLRKLAALTELSAPSVAKGASRLVDMPGVETGILRFPRSPGLLDRLAKPLGALLPYSLGMNSLFDEK